MGKCEESNVEDSDNISDLHAQISPISRAENTDIKKESLCPHGTKRLFFCLIFGVEGTLPHTPLDDVAIGGELLQVAFDAGGAEVGA